MKLKKALRYSILIVVLGLIMVFLLVTPIFSDPVFQLNPVNTDGFGVTENHGIDRMLDAGGYIFLGVDNPNGTTIYRSRDGKTWEKISDYGINGDARNQWTTTLIWFRNALYVGTWQSGSAQSDVAQMFRANAGAKDVNDIVWETINLDGFGNVNNDGFTNGMVFDGYMYVGCFNGTEGTEIWRSKTGDPDDWEMCAPKSFNRADNSDSTIMYVHEDYLYVGTEMVRGPSSGRMGTALYRTAGGEGEIVWEQVNPNGYGERANINTGSIKVFKGYMYVGTWNLSGCQVWRSNMQGEPPWDWEKVASGGFGNRWNHIAQYLDVLGGNIYLGCFGSFYFSFPNQSGKLMTSKDGTNWEQITAPDFIRPGIMGILAMTSYKDKLYVGLFGSSAQSEVWVYEK